jgi:hypothetical protein
MRVKTWTVHHAPLRFHVLTFGISVLLVALLAWVLGIALASVSASPQVTQPPLSAETEAEAEPAAPAEFPGTPLPSQAGSGPMLTMVPGESIQQRYILRDGQVQPVFIFRTQFPKFIGSANIEQSYVKLDIFGDSHVTGKAPVDSNGNWSYQSAVPLLPAIYQVQAELVADPADEALASDSLLFEVVLENKQAVEVLRAGNQPQVGNNGTLFDVRTTIEQTSKVLTAGQEAKANVELVNFGAANQPVDVEVQYNIRDATNKVVLQSSETIAVDKQASFWKTFQTALSLVPGSYTLTVAVPSRDLIATATDTFQIKTAAASDNNSFLGISNIGLTISSPGTAALVTITLLLIVWIAYMQYRKVVMLSQLIKSLARNNSAVAKQIAKVKS